MDQPQSSSEPPPLAEEAAADPATVDPATADATAEEPGSGHIGGIAVPTMVDGWPVFPSVRERYYSSYTTKNHQSVHVHSNGLCVLSIAPTHPSIQPPLRVVGVRYRSHDGKNLLKTSVSGKGKKGSIFLSERDMVCDVDVSDGSTFKMYACIRGSVIEINERLIAQPQLLGEMPLSDGFVCVMMPKLVEKRAIGQACMEFDHSVLTDPSGNEKRRQDGLQVRSKPNKKQKKDDPRPCFSFAKGYCKWGSSCKFSHGNEAPAGEPVAASVVKEEQQPAADDAGAGAAGGLEGSSVNASVDTPDGGS